MGSGGSVGNVYPAERRSLPVLRRLRGMARALASAVPFSHSGPSTSLVLKRHGRGDHAMPNALLVLLPGFGEKRGDFSFEALIGEAWEAGLDIDALEFNTRLAQLFPGARTVVRRLHEKVIVPARREGYEHIWLVGFSLGGVGALSYVREHPESVDGVVLLAPYLGRRRLIEVLRGPDATYATPQPSEFRHELWDWLAGPAPKPPIYLGFGNEDKYAGCHRLLAELLPKARVFVTPGGHDWSTWTRLWTTIVPHAITHPRHWA